MSEQKLVPELRFPEFEGEWDVTQVQKVLTRFQKPVDVIPEKIYREIGVRSHGKGVFHKPEILGKELGEKRVFWVHPKAFIVNIVFAWERAVALTSESDEGFIASHRFPMYLPKNNRVDLSFLSSFFIRPRGKFLLELASPGGAGRNKTLGQKDFSELKICIPKLSYRSFLCS